MKAYSASDEEAIRAQALLKDWAGEGYITPAQREQMERETICTLRRTNIFLRLAAFGFTLLIIAAALGLFYLAFLERSTATTTGVFVMLFALACYAAAELAVSQAKLYRFGIEEAFAVCSVVLLCVGIFIAFDVYKGGPLLVRPKLVAPLIGSICSLWIWHRFGLPYALLGALLSAAWQTGYWVSTRTEQHIAVAAFFAIAQLSVIAMAPRYRHTYLHQKVSIAEALLWLGIYLACNLEISASHRSWLDWGGLHDEFPRPFYWSTWALIWCVPPVVILRGLRQKDKAVFAVGILSALLTLLTNKSYLGTQSNTWDPMILGALLIGVALAVRQWVSTGPGGVRYGFTAQRLSGTDKSLLDAGIAVSGLVSPHIQAPAPPAPSPEVRFGGGDSGGAGASSDF
ncbi:MAG: hypothetical protein NTV52_25325 [Acidobacteria bacterium]|nr:hypothetical protein [Acidobacteriota bacterium]